MLVASMFIINDLTFKYSFAINRPFRNAPFRNAPFRNSALGDARRDYLVNE